MSPFRRALLGLAAAGVGFGLLDATLTATSDFILLPGLWVAMTLWLGWGFIGVGLFAWARRPDNRVGALMAATGFAWFLGALGFSDTPLLFTVGQMLGSVFFVAGVHLLLAFPTGRLRSSFDRRLVTVGYLLTTIGVLPLWLFAEPRDLGCDNCPHNVFLIQANSSVVDVYGLLINVVALVIIVVVAVSLVRRWRDATEAERRFVVPVYAAGVALMVAVFVSIGVQTTGTGDTVAEIAFIAALIPFGLVPWLFLATLVRSRMIQGGAVGQLIARLGEAPPRGEMREALSRALRDPSLELLYWIPDDRRYVDARGHAVDLPDPGTGRTVSPVEREGRPVAAIVHDASLLEDPELVRTAGAAAALALENERLDAELRAKVEELRESRARMLRAGLEDRRALERNLHDGAQQRLVSMALNLRLARSKLRDDPVAAEVLIDGAGSELDEALAELRELARGIHPAVLTERGLAPALATLAGRAPLPVEVIGDPGADLSEAQELAAYFVVSEALTNVAKYAHASQAVVNLGRENGRLVVEVADDGVGGADPKRGTGLQGLADRLAAVDGRLEVDSPQGRGTTVRARIPCG
ncbi:MAG TPA: histidine kinase [Thermoleophilaceae bacterium]